ncbi:hypothetical protein J53TS2_10920 [Paenibacillus sp. J53TS2]|nr:hypothetical protein J53TS2_10920 [Paenibacillus sp. J53TS2]
MIGRVKEKANQYNPQDRDIQMKLRRMAGETDNVDSGIAVPPWRNSCPDKRNRQSQGSGTAGSLRFLGRW